MGKIWASIGWPIAMATSATVLHHGGTVSSLMFLIHQGVKSVETTMSLATYHYLYENTKAWKATRQPCRRRRTITVMKILANLSPAHTLHTWEHNMVSIRDWIRTLSLISNGKLTLPHNLTSDGLRVFQLNYNFPHIHICFHVTIY